MANKLLEIEQLAEQTAMDLSKDPDAWLRFLNTSSRACRYDFSEQLLIHAQNQEFRLFMVERLSKFTISCKLA